MIRRECKPLSQPLNLQRDLGCTDFTEARTLCSGIPRDNFVRSDALVAEQRTGDPFLRGSSCRPVRVVSSAVPEFRVRFVYDQVTGSFHV